MHSSSQIVIANTNFKIFYLKNYSMNFVGNCKIDSKEVLVNEINEIINSNKINSVVSVPICI